MKVRRIKNALSCPCCGELYDAADGVTVEAHQPESTEAFLCGECETLYEDRDEAKECCR